jgi:hypothetical protein
VSNVSVEGCVLSCRSMSADQRVRVWLTECRRVAFELQGYRTLNNKPDTWCFWTFNFPIYSPAWAVAKPRTRDNALAEVEYDYLAPGRTRGGARVSPTMETQWHSEWIVNKAMGLPRTPGFETEQTARRPALYTISEVANHRRGPDFWVIEPNAVGDMEVYDITGQFRSIRRRFLLLTFFS